MPVLQEQKPAMYMDVLYAENAGAIFCAIPRSYKARHVLFPPLTNIPVGHTVMRRHRCAIRGVAWFTYRVKITYTHNRYYFK